MAEFTEETLDQLARVAFSAPSMTKEALLNAIHVFTDSYNSVKGTVKMHGKMNLTKLKESGYSIQNIEITRDNIGDFKRIARKYNIDFALKRTVSPSGEKMETVFFKARDGEIMKKAFTEYVMVNNEKKRNKDTKQRSYKDRMRDAKQKQQERKAQGKDRQKTRGQDMSTPNI